MALVLHWAWQRGSAASAVVRSRSRSLMVLAAPLPLVILTCCVGSLRESAGEQPEGLFWTYIESSEYLPLPAETQLLNSDYNGVSQGPAILELTVAATDAATPEQLATRLAGHYSTHGWHMSAVRVFDGVKYRGCRRVQGLIRWADHCMTFHDGRTERWILVSISIDGMSDHQPSTTPRG